MENDLGNWVKVEDVLTKPPTANDKAKGLASEMYSERVEIEVPISKKYTWEIHGWSKIKDTSESIISKFFHVGDYKWEIGIQPPGNGDFANQNVSVFLQGSKTCLPSDKGVYLKYKFTVRDQLQGKHKSCMTYHYSFSSKSHSSGMIKNLLSIKEMNDPSRGFLVNDTLIIEAQVTFMGHKF